MLLNEGRRDGLGLSSSTRSKFRLPRARLNRRDVRSPDQGSPPATTAASPYYARSSKGTSITICISLSGLLLKTLDLLLQIYNANQ